MGMISEYTRRGISGSTRGRVNGCIRGRTRISTSPKGYISDHKSTATEAIQEGNIEATCQNTFATCERISNKA